jgi:hypothetical protein
MPKNTNAQGRRENTPYIMLINPVFDSPAFQDLSGGAVQTYLMLIRRFNGLNNGEISLSCREVAEYFGIGKGTASKKLEELQMHGFITCMEKGRFTRKMATVWKLNHLPTSSDYGKHIPPTNEWKQYDSSLKQVPNIELKVPI